MYKLFLSLLISTNTVLSAVEVKYSQVVKSPEHKEELRGIVDCMSYVAEALPEMDEAKARIKAQNLSRLFLIEKDSPLVMIEVASSKIMSASRMLQQRYDYIDRRQRPVDSWPADWKRVSKRYSEREKVDNVDIWIIGEHVENAQEEIVLGGEWTPCFATFRLGSTCFGISLNESVWQGMSQGSPAPDLISIATRVLHIAQAWGLGDGISSAVPPQILPGQNSQASIQNPDTRDLSDLLALLNQRGYIEAVTDEEKAAANKALLAFLENEKAPLRRACEQFAPELRPDESTLETAAILRNLGLDITADDVAKPVNIPALDKVMDSIEIEFEDEDPETPLMTTGDIFRSVVADRILDNLDQLPEWEGQPSRIASSLKDELNGKKQADRKAFEVFNENWFDRMMKPIEDEIAVWTDDSSKPRPLTDEEKKAQEKEASKSTGQQIFDLALSKASDKTKAKLTDKIKSRGESGQRFLANADKLNNLKDYYDTAKEIKKDYDTLQKDMRETGTGLALFKVGCKVVGESLGKLGPLGEAAEKYIDGASKTADAASQATKEFYEGATEGEVLIQQRSNPANRVLNAVDATEQVGDEAYYTFDLPSSDGSSQKVKVGGWKKVIVKGETHYQVLDDNMNPTNLVMSLKNPPWYRVFGDHEACFYDLKTGKVVNTLKVDI